MEFGTMTEKSDYQKHWEELANKAHSIARTYRRTVNPREVGISDKYDGERVNCHCWELDRGYIQQNLYGDMAEPDAAADYIMKIIRDGPMCHYCLWNDGGPKSCVHPQIEDCPHEKVKAHFEWDLHMSAEQVYEVDWEKGLLKSASNKTEGGAHDGTRTKTWQVVCEKCHVKLDLDKIDGDLVTAMEDEY